MKALIIVGIILVALGVVALIYQGFSYTTERQVADLGIAEIRSQQTETVPVPPWVGVVLVGIGVGMILLAKRSNG